MYYGIIAKPEALVFARAFSSRHSVEKRDKTNPRSMCLAYHQFIHMSVAE